MSIYKDPHDFLLGAAAVTGCTRVEVQDTSTAETVMSDDGTGTHFVRHGLTRFTATFNDAKQAKVLENATTADVDVTFAVNDEGEAETTVTLTNVKTGGRRGAYTDGADVWVVEGVCDSASDPT